MKKLFFNLLSLLFLGTTSLFFTACSGNEGGTDTGNPQTPTADTSNEEQACLDAGGTWVEFSNGCVDSCESQRDSTVSCTQSLTFGCECGDEQCWNSTDKVCEDI